jgi:hypothetical protein
LKPLYEGSEKMSRTYRKTKTNTIKKTNIQRRFKKNKSSWKVFREEKNYLKTMKDVKQHIAKVGA